MMTQLSYDIINALQGKSLVTAESCTGGGIGAALTEIPGSSAVYKGGIICYTNTVKASVLGISEDLLENVGAVSAPVAEAMAAGVRTLLQADMAISVTGLAGPTGDNYGNPVGTVYIGFADCEKVISKKFQFSGNRSDIRRQAIIASLELIKEHM